MRLMLLFVPLALMVAQNRSVPVENDFVRVLSVIDQPVSKPGAMHEHTDNRVMIYLDPGDIQIRYADGREENQHWKAGDVAWSPANGKHTSQNVSAKPVRIIEIEVRTKRPKALVSGREAPGKALVENPQVHVYRTKKGPVTAPHYVAVDVKTAAVTWNKMPDTPGPFVITEVK